LSRAKAAAQTARKRTLLVLVASIVVSFVVSACILSLAAWQLRVKTEQQATAAVENVVALLSRSISAEFSKSDVTLQAVVREMEQRIANGDLNRGAINDYIARLSALNPELFAVRVVDTEGIVRFGVDQSGNRIPADSRVNVSDRDYFRQAQQQEKPELIYTPPFMGRVINKPVIQLVRRISRPDGGFAGAAYVAFDIDYLNRQIKDVNLGPHGMSLLRMQDATVVARYSPSSPDETLIGRKIITKTFQAMVASQPEHGSYWTVTPSDGLQRLYAYRRVPGYPGYILAGMSEQDVTTDWWTNLFLLGLLLPVFLISAFVLWRALLSLKQQLEQEYVDKSLLAAIVDSSNDAIIGTDLQGLVTSWNHAATSLFGFDSVEVMGRPLVDLIVPPTLRQEDADILSCLRQGEIIPHFRTQRQRQDGSRMHVSVSVSPVRNAKGEIIGGSKTIRDISLQKEAEDQVRDQNLLLEAQVNERTQALSQVNKTLQTTLTAMELVGIGVHWLDYQTGRFLFSNNRFANMLGYTVDELLELHLWEIEPDWTEERFFATREQIRQDRLLTLTSQPNHRNGLPLMLELTIIHQPAFNDLPEMFIGFSLDISRRKQAEDALRDSQEVASALMNASTDAAMLLDEDGNILAVNDAMAHRFRSEVDGMLGQNFYAMLPPVLAVGRRAACEHVIASGKSTLIQDERDGMILENRIFPVPSLDGKVRRVAVFSRDITQRFHAEQTILRLTEQYRQLFTDSPDAHMIMDQEAGRILDCNRAAEWLLRADRSALIGKTPAELSPPRQPDGRLSTEAAAEKIATSLREGHHRFEWLHRRPDGSDFWSETTISLSEYQGQQALFTAWRDISDRKRAEAELQAMRDHLAKTNAELEQFAYIASHDLRQPLRTISSYLSLIERQLGEGLSGELHEFFGFAVGGAKRMDALITGLLDYSRTGKSKADSQVDVQDVVADAVACLTKAIQDSQAEVTVAADLPQVQGDPVELSRLFQNLIGNALKYHAPDRPPQISVSAERQDGEWVIAVRDNGIGIAPQDRDRAFAIFQRLVARDEYEGTGIGLAICKKIVEHHGGRIWIESEPGQGSVFLIALPALR